MHETWRPRKHLLPLPSVWKLGERPGGLFVPSPAIRGGFSPDPYHALRAWRKVGCLPPEQATRTPISEVFEGGGPGHWTCHSPMHSFFAECAWLGCCAAASG